MRCGKGCKLSRSLCLASVGLDVLGLSVLLLIFEAGSAFRAESSSKQHSQLPSPPSHLELRAFSLSEAQPMRTGGETMIMRLRGGEEQADSDVEHAAAPGASVTGVQDVRKNETEAEGGAQAENAEGQEDAVYEEVNLEDLEFDDIEEEYTYPCPCGDEFLLSHAQILAGERIAPCPSCSLRIRIIAKGDVIDAMHHAIHD